MVNGKNIALTGASSGIGKAIAHELAGAGANLILIGRDEERLTQVQQTLGGTHQALVADISTEDGRQSIVEACQVMESGLDILVNKVLNTILYKFLYKFPYKFPFKYTYKFPYK